MSVHEFVVGTCRPSPIGHAQVGAHQWFGGRGTITGIRAKWGQADGGKFNLSMDPASNMLVAEEVFGAVPLWHLRARDILTAEVSGQAITKWMGYDSAMVLGQEATNQPVIEDDEGPNSNPGLLFDGVDDKMGISTGRTLFESGDPFTLAFTIGNLTYTGGSSDQAPLVGSFDTGKSDSSVYGRDSRQVTRNDAGGVKMTTTKVTAGSEIRVVTWAGSGSGLNEYVDGDQTITNQSLSASGDFSWDTLGAWADSSEDEFLNAALSEVMLFDDVLTEDSRQLIEGLLAWPVGLEGSLLDTDGSDNHPYKSTNPVSSNYMMASDIDLGTAYGTVVSESSLLVDGAWIRFYLTECQIISQPANLTVEITFDPEE